MLFMASTDHKNAITKSNFGYSLVYPASSTEKSENFTWNKGAEHETGFWHGIYN